MLKIRVLVPIIVYDDLQKILNHYNATKSIDEEPLELLDRCEGGFQIVIPHMKGIKCDANRKIKQLRWNKRYLDSYNYINFTEKELTLLYNSLCKVLGKNNVQME